MSISTIEIKFPGYENSFKNVEQITDELQRMIDNISEIESSLQGSDFGSDEFKNFASQLSIAETELNNFNAALNQTDAISNHVIKQAIQSNKEYQQTLEESKKALNEAFSPEAIVEFSAKASAAFIGLGEAFGGTGGEAIKSVERIQKALITVNAIKDSAEVAISAFDKFKKSVAAASAAQAVAGKQTTLLGKGFQFLGKMLSSPFALLTAIIAVIVTVTSVFGDLATAINFVSDAVGGLVSAFKALVSFENPLTAFNKEYERLGNLRGAEKNVFKVAQNAKLAVDELEKLNKELQLANTISEKREASNKIFKKSIDLTNQEIEAQSKLLQFVEKKSAAEEEAQIKLNELKAKSTQLITQNELDNRDFTLSSIELINEASEISSRAKIRALNRELEFNTSNTETQLSSLDKLKEAEKQNIKNKIQGLQSISFANEAQLNELASLQDELNAKDLEYEKLKNEARIRSGQTQRAILEANNQILIAANEKQLGFINLSNQAGVDAATNLITKNKELQEKAINAELSKYNLIKKLTDDEYIAKKNLENQLQEVRTQAEERIKQTILSNIDIEASREVTAIQNNSKQKELFQQRLNAIAAEEISSGQIVIEQLERRTQQFGALFNRRQIYKNLESEISKQYDIQFNLISREAQKQLDELKTEEKLLLLEKERLLNKQKIQPLNDKELEQLGLIDDQVRQLEERGATIQIELKTKISEKTNEEFNTLRELNIKKQQEQIADFQAFAQGLADVGKLIIESQTAFLDSKLNELNAKKEAAQSSIDSINDQLNITNNSIGELQERINNNVGSAQEAFKNAQSEELNKQQSLNALLEQQKGIQAGIAKQEAQIAKEKEKLQRIQILTQSALTISQSIGAVANAAAQSGATAPVVVPLVIAAIGAGFAAVKALSKGFSDGGFTGGNKKDIKGVVHGDEWVAPSWQVNHPLFSPAIDYLEKGRLRGYAQGGMVVEPQTNQLIQSQTQTQFPNLVVSVVDVSKALDRVGTIEDLTNISL